MGWANHRPNDRPASDSRILVFFLFLAARPSVQGKSIRGLTRHQIRYIPMLYRVWAVVRESHALGGWKSVQMADHPLAHSRGNLAGIHTRNVSERPSS